jgi:hypothetical protein
VEEEYKGCCDSINTKDISTKQKHWFTNRHCLNLSEKYQEAVPNFVCPAFLAFNSKCRAKYARPPAVMIGSDMHSFFLFFLFQGREVRLGRKALPELRWISRDQLWPK